MGHYKSNLRDIEFNLFEVLGQDDVLGTGPFAEVDGETAREILARGRPDRPRGPGGVVRGGRPDASGLRPGDPHRARPRVLQEELPHLDGRRVLAAGRPPRPRRYAGHVDHASGRSARWSWAPTPRSGCTARARCSPASSTATATSATRRSPSSSSTGGWVTTMVLTEPDAGSDVGAGRTKATPNDDGTWNIEGVKRFITSAESDLSDNVIHMVLARPHGVEGAGGPGTKGLSLFIVPKFHFDVETGELTGERNGVYVTGVEHKMGIKVSNTCELTFGDPGVGGGEPARGWLLGEVHHGIAQMFQVIENARMMVGTKAIATLSTGYLNALDFAKERVQGADLTQAADKTAPRVTITHHPDVRRSLMTQKSFAEAMRALVLYTASWQDTRRDRRARRREGRAGDGGQRPAAADREGLRLGAFVGAARHRVAADVRRVGLPAGLPDRAVRPRRQDRHPLRGHDGDPGSGPLLPQDRQGPGPRARPPGERDPVLRAERGRQRPAQGRACAPRDRARGRPGDRRAHDRGPDERRRVGRGRRRPQHLQGRPQHQPPADGARRRGLRAG